MVVKIVKDSEQSPLTGEVKEFWVANKVDPDSGFLGLSTGTASDTFDTQKEAIKAGRRLADPGERIVVKQPSGDRVIRQGN